MNVFWVLYDDAFIERALLNGVCVLNVQTPSSRSCSSAASLQTNNCQVIRVCGNKMIYVAPPWSPREIYVHCSSCHECSEDTKRLREVEERGGRDGCKWE